MTKMTHNDEFYACGCLCPETHLRNFGRGAARRRRIAEQIHNQMCPWCALENARLSLRKLTATSPITGQPYSLGLLTCRLINNPHYQRARARYLRMLCANK